MALLCFQNRTSAFSRSYHPFATTPCSAGEVPVTIDDCAVQVTAGNTGGNDWMPLSFANFVSPGMCSPSSDLESPTRLMTARRMVRTVES